MAKALKKESGHDVQKVEPPRLMTPFEEMERMFDDYFSRGWMRPFQSVWPSMPKMTAAFEGKMPSVDVIDRDSEILVRAELPGVDKKDLEISVTHNTVSIKGQTRKEEKEEKGDYYRCEISRGSYARTLSLPADVDESRAKANFRDGILELTLPKMNKSKRHTIKID